MAKPLSSPILRFSIFEFDLETRELTRAGYPQKLQDQPARILAALLRTPGQIVTRKALQDELWATDTFVEFEIGLNTAVRKLRHALGDSADQPRFIETIPKQGYRFIGDVKPAASVAETRGSGLSTAEPPAPAANRWLRPGVVAVGIVLVSALACWMLLIRQKSREIPRLTTRLTLDLPPSHLMIPGGGRKVAIDPSGQWLAYLAREGSGYRMYRRSLDGASPKSVPGTEGALSVAISPDGGRILFSTQEAFKEVSLDSGEVREIAPVTDSRSLPVRLADGSYFFSGPGDQAGLALAIWKKDAVSGKAEPLTSKSTPWTTPEYHFPLQLLPGGQLLYNVTGSPQQRALWVRSLSTGQSRMLLDQAMGGEYLPTGHLLYHWGANLYAARFDPATLESPGRGALVVEQVARMGWSGAQASVSQNGTLVYMKAIPPEPRELVWVDLQGHETRVSAPPADYVPLDLSADGKLALITRQDSFEQWSTWILHLDSGTWQQLASQIDPTVSGVFSPDGRLAALSGIGFGFRLLRVENGTLERYIQTEYGAHPQFWSAEHNRLTVTMNPPGRGLRVGLAALDTLAESHGITELEDLSPPGKALETGAAISPDGRWLAYSSRANELGKWRVFVRGLEQGMPLEVSDGDGGWAPLWAPDGKTIYFRSAGFLSAVSFDPSQTPPRISSPRRLFADKYHADTSWVRNYCLSADGKRFLFARTLESLPYAHKLEVVINWFDEVERLAGKGAAR